MAKWLNYYLKEREKCQECQHRFFVLSFFLGVYFVFVVVNKFANVIGLIFATSHLFWCLMAFSLSLRQVGGQTYQEIKKNYIYANSVTKTKRKGGKKTTPKRGSLQGWYEFFDINWQQQIKGFFKCLKRLFFFVFWV